MELHHESNPANMRPVALSCMDDGGAAVRAREAIVIAGRTS
jgi:hypothetical protein